MRGEITFAVCALAIPLAAAAGSAWACRRFAPRELAARYWLAIGLAVGFLASYCLLPDHGPLVPDKHWHWLPHLAAVATLGAMAQAAGVSLIERLTALAVLALVAAWQLVPLWPDLAPPRSSAVPLLAGYFWVLMSLLVALPDRLLGRWFVGLLVAAAAVVAVIVAASVSFKYGQLAAAASASAAGCCAATWIDSARRPAATAAPDLPAGIRGMLPGYVILVAGSAFLGAIDPSPPQPAILLAPAIPLVMWIFAAPWFRTSASR